jgi:hypothetical protein
MSDGETSHTIRRADENGEHAGDRYAKRTSERIVVARAHYRPPARVPVCRSDRFIVFEIRTQCCCTPFWFVELFDVLELEFKNAIALDLLSRVRMKIRMGTKEIIDTPEASGVSARPKPCSEP